MYTYKPKILVLAIFFEHLSTNLNVNKNEVKQCVDLPTKTEFSIKFNCLNWEKKNVVLRFLKRFKIDLSAQVLKIKFKT